MSRWRRRRSSGLRWRRAGCSGRGGGLLILLGLWVRSACGDFGGGAGGLGAGHVAEGFEALQLEAGGLRVSGGGGGRVLILLELWVRSACGDFGSGAGGLGIADVGEDFDELLLGDVGHCE